MLRVQNQMLVLYNVLVCQSPEAASCGGSRLTPVEDQTKNKESYKPLAMGCLSPKLFFLNVKRENQCSDKTVHIFLLSGVISIQLALTWLAVWAVGTMHGPGVHCKLLTMFSLSGVWANLLGPHKRFKMDDSVLVISCCCCCYVRDTAWWGHMSAQPTGTGTDT